MKNQEFIDQFKKRVYSLTVDRQLDFAILISKKLYVDYQNFFESHKWGDPDLLMDAIKICENAKIIFPDKKAVELMLSKIESITPDMDDFGDESSSYGLNACIAVIHALQFLLNKDSSNIVYIGTALTDTIDLRVQENEDLSEEQIDVHPMMQEARMFLLKQIQ